MTLNGVIAGRSGAVPVFLIPNRMILMALLFLPATLLHAAGFWSTAASACVIDEASVSKFAASGAQLNFLAGQTGQVVARCNITNPLDSGGNPNWNILQVTYKDQDGTATANQVLVTLKRVHVTDGVSSTIATFNSNGYSGSSLSQSKLQAVSHTFDFLNYAYYIEIVLSRSSAVAGNDPALYRVGLFRFTL